MMLLMGCPTWRLKHRLLQRVTLIRSDSPVERLLPPLLLLQMQMPRAGAHLPVPEPSRLNLLHPPLDLPLEQLTLAGKCQQRRLRIKAGIPLLRRRVC